MASQVEDNLQCPSCLEIFKDPVMLPCSHSFCRACLRQWWEEKGDGSCPVCRTEFKSMDPPLNLALKNVCEAFSQASLGSEDICRVHKEKPKLYCLDHHESVCLVCRDATIHAGHKFCPLDEAAHRDKVQGALQDVKQTLHDYIKMTENCNEQEEYIKVQREQVERKIKKDFEELHHFLQFEEEARLSALREEEKQKSQMMKEKIKALSKDMAALSDVIRTTEEHLTSDHVSFMNSYQAAMARLQRLPDKPKPLQGALLDEVKYVGNLKFTVWERMKEMIHFSPVILDPNTAGPALKLSEDLTSMSFKVGQQRPKNPERIQDSSKVIGCVLDSTNHIWEVEVGDNTDWEVGVEWQNCQLPDDTHRMGIGFRHGEYRSLRQPYLRWNSPAKPQRIRVCTNRNVFSFYDSLTNTELRNDVFWGVLLLGKIFPYFDTKDKSPLKIIRLTPCVMTHSHN